MEKIVILGAGISGLSAAFLLRENGFDVEVLEASDRVGGLARSFNWHGFDCDIAPHRFFATDTLVRDRILDLVPMDAHRRKSRIIIGGRKVQDPVNPLELVLRLPPRISLRLVLGYLFKPKLPADSFENLALNKFGQGLYEFFFEPYTRKMFGVPPSEISVEWARQKLRVSGLRDAIRRDTKIYFSQFYYPKQGGYGAIAEKIYGQVRDAVRLEAKVIGVETGGNRISAVRFEQNGVEQTVSCDRVVSTLPATVLGRLLGHNFSLRFQRVTLVYLLVDKPQVMPYHWVYFADGDVVINRLAEFKNFANKGLPPSRTVMVAEVTMKSDQPVSEVISALERFGFLDADEVIDSMTLTEAFGYPVFDRDFDRAGAESNDVFGRFENLHLVGRNAEFRHIELDENFSSAMALVQELKSTQADDRQPVLAAQSVSR